MPRRRSSKGRDSGPKHKPLKRSDGKIKKWNTRDDIPMDEEDQFHNSKDKILLEGNNDEWEEDGDDEEVFALKGMEDDSDEDQQYNEDEDEEQEEEVVAPVKKKTKKSKKSKTKSVDEDEKSEEDQEPEESWGKGRAAYYSSNADQLESDDEEGNELEEQEAKRLQSKMREEMKEDDFGLDDTPVLENTPAEAEDILDPTPSILPALGTDKKSLLRHLEKTSPESLALARDWDDTARNLQRTREKIAKLQTSDSDTLSLGMVHLHYQALLSYSTTLAFYLHLRSSAKYAQRPALLQSHPILQRLLTLKQSLQTLEDLDFAASDSEDEEEDSEFSEMDMVEILADGEKLWGADDDDEEEVDSDELAELLKEAREQEASRVSESRSPKRPKKKRKTVEEADKPVTPAFDLVEPEFTTSKPSSSRRHPADASTVDAFGEDVTLHSVDAADKSARKKSLRFHTSKIESASARRQGARNQASGGDDDIPYRERKREKDARLVKEAAIRAQNQIGAELDDEDPEPRVGDKRSRDDDESDGSGDDYYELVKKRSKEDKIKKKAQYEEEHGLSRVPLDDGETSGPRSLTRAILTNKGLTPRRPKSVRNPRVKKRERYEKAKKKLSSQKAIYKGGLAESHGRYDGERSGISKVVKSVQLG